jgi:subtilisin family serine protease
MKIAIIDSGITPAPETGPVAGGISFVDETTRDALGHGTAVAAVIHALAPEAELYAVKIFHRTLITDAVTLARALRWAREMDFVNLSLGTANPEHRELLARAVAGCRGTVVAAAGHLPGDLAGVVRVAAGAGAACRQPDGTWSASPAPPELLGIPERWRPEGVSFAVARVTGLLAARRLNAGTRAQPW